LSASRAWESPPHPTAHAETPVSPSPRKRGEGTVMAFARAARGIASDPARGVQLRFSAASLPPLQLSNRVAPGRDGVIDVGLRVGDADVIFALALHQAALAQQLVEPGGDRL